MNEACPQYTAKTRMLGAAFGVLATLGFLTPSNVAAKTSAKVLWNFCTTDACSGVDQVDPSGLVRDANGNLYGMTGENSGKDKFGSIFELKRNGRKWQYKELYSFTLSDPAGSHPYGGLIIDEAGNLYGSANTGGANSQGSIFELSPNAAKTKWTAKALYSFCPEDGCADGANPSAKLTYAGAATGAPYDGTSPLFGVAFSGGGTKVCQTTFACGVAFELTPSGKSWKEQVLYTFCQKNNCADGDNPDGALLMDAKGNLFGVTESGGLCGDECGIAFELSKKGSKWSEKVLHSFCALSGCSDGQFPVDNLVMDASGTLYGETHWGGTPDNNGTLYSLTPSGKKWKYTVLYTFCGLANCTDGKWPEGGLIMDSKGNLFGTNSLQGGNDQNGGAVFEFNKTASSLHSFCAETDCKDGKEPLTGVIMDQAGNLFGTTEFGGSKGWGAIFEITP